MTVSTETWYTGYDPYTLEPVKSAKTQQEKLAQRQFFFWYKPEERRGIEQSLRRIGRADLISELSGINRKNVAASNRACVALAVQTLSANYVPSIVVVADLTPPFVQRPQHLFVQQIWIQQLTTTLRFPNPCITLANNGKIIS